MKLYRTTYNEVWENEECTTEIHSYKYKEVTNDDLPTLLAFAESPGYHSNIQISMRAGSAVWDVYITKTLDVPLPDTEFQDL